MTMAKVDGLETTKETQVVVEASSRHVDEIMIDCGNQCRDNSSTVAFCMVCEDEHARKDVGGSMHSIKNTTKEVLQFFIPTTLTCHHCQEKGHYALFCPNKARVPPKTIHICLYFHESCHKLIDCPFRLRAKGELERIFEEVNNRYKDDDDEEATEGESSDEKTVCEYTSIGIEDSHRLAEDSSHTLADGAKIEDLKDSKGGECEEVKGMASEVVDEGASIKVHMRSQENLLEVYKFYAWSIEVVQDGVTLEELGVKLDGGCTRQWSRGTTKGTKQDWSKVKEDRVGAVGTRPTRKKTE